ncbi:TROVE domain-containing protein [Nocardia sp. NPDC004568]|uniref:TROVE domain-containing protein n=1 Tax=Nocardia sp. NPDC004568 TaxID=3154551 RepID=UPI00339E04F0
MAKFNVSTARPVGHVPIRTDSTATGTTYEGEPGYARDAQSELFLLAVTNMVGESTFYEAAGNRDSRFSELVRQIAVTDFDWLTRFARWLRGEANLRSASLVLAAEGTKASLAAGQPGSRALIASILQRADEPGEFISYWHTHYGRRLPMAVKRGVADAAARLYNQRTYLKWDSESRGVRFADVVQLAHVDPRSEGQSALFKYAIEARIGIEGLTIPEELGVLRANARLRALGPDEIRSLAKTGSLAERLSAAGVTWEAVPSLVNGPWTKDLWESIIPSMGYMALLRNLRNFDQAGVSDAVAAKVAARLSDPEQVAKSRQLPMRFLSAYRAAPSLRWSYPLELALDAAVANIPALSGRTLILIDTSGSMNAGFSKDGSLKRWDAAVVFGLALARRCHSTDTISYSDHGMRFELQPGESLLRAIDRWQRDGYFIGNGTATAGAVQATFDRHDRVVILTDEQAGGGGDPGGALPASVPLYTWNLAGYRYGHAAGGPNRHTFGGLTDKGFDTIPLLERGRNADWPF